MKKITEKVTEVKPEAKSNPAFIAHKDLVMRVDDILYWFAEYDNIAGINGYSSQFKRWVVCFKNGEKIHLFAKDAGPALLEMLKIYCPVLVAPSLK